MISICVITRDECEKLERLTDSLEGLTLELVVVDTGSVDNTIDMLKQKQAKYNGKPEIKIEHFAWIKDFSAAKNYAARCASNETVMILDSDEWMLFTDKGKLSALVASAEAMADSKKEAVGRIKRHNLITVSGEERVNTEWINRIFSKVLYEYKGAIHEQLVKKGESEDYIYETYTTGIEIYHDGYLGTKEEKQKKSRRNIELLILELTKTGYSENKGLGMLTDEYYRTEKKVPYILYQLGKSYYMAGGYSEAAYYLGEALFFDLDERLEYVIDLVECYGYALVSCGKQKDALMLEGVYDAFGHSADFRFLMGYIYMQNAMFDEAIKQFLSATECESARMEGVNSYLAYYDCGVICEVLGRTEEARTYYEKAKPYEKAAEGLLRLDRAGEEPYLIIYGVRYCYNILNEILKGIEGALRRMGHRVETYDEQEGEIAGLSKYADRSFKGIFAVQTYLYNVYLESSQEFLFDRIKGPKYNIVLDHPGWLSHLFARLPKETCVLTHDKNYRDFVEKYYGQVHEARLFPMAGVPVKDSGLSRRYGLVFIGTYGDYRGRCAQIRDIANPFIRHLANRYLLIMRKNVDMTAEEAFKRALEYYDKQCDDETFLKLFSAMNPVLSCVMYYYREKTIKTLLDGGVNIDIWGSSWKNCRFHEHECLTLHEDLEPADSIRIMESARISLNIMAWHKGGFTERMAQTMLSGALLLTDKTSFFDTADSDGVEQFDLNELTALPDRVKYLLSHEDELKELAKRGRENAERNHTWDVRVRCL